MPAVASDSPRGIAAGEFACLMSPLGPFETRPHVAVGCSGGADSMALALLLDGWVRAQRGKLMALTFDHRLRPDSTAEAKQVGAWLRARGIEHVILTRPEAPIAGNLQAGARDARYARMSSWCRANGVLHLALAHHREDQAETVLLRLGRGSGVDGLAAIAPVTETPDVRLLRPLLDVPRARLAATLATADQDHIEDPSNRNEAFARVRLRNATPILEREGLTPARLAATARRMARARTALEQTAARLLAEGVTLFPEGYAVLDLAPFRAVAAEIALRALSRLLATVSGNAYPPRFDRIERLWLALRVEGTRPTARTIGGCRVLPLKRSAHRFLICREPRAASESVPVQAGEILWDGRFRIRIRGKSRCDVRQLGRQGWDDLVADRPDLRKSGVPAAVRPSLPSFWYLDELVSVPHLSYMRYRAVEDPPTIRELTFEPRKPLTEAGFLYRQSGSESLTLGDAV